MELGPHEGDGGGVDSSIATTTMVCDTFINKVMYYTFISRVIKNKKSIGRCFCIKKR